MSDLTYEEFCALPLTYTRGMTSAWGAHRMYRNEDLGIQKEVVTARKRYDDIYSGWEYGKASFYLDNDPREFANSAELYEAWMRSVCGMQEVES